MMTEPCEKQQHHGRCCCNCRHHARDYHHCGTSPELRSDAQPCVCMVPKGWVCALERDTGGDRVHSGWSEHGLCDGHEFDGKGATPKQKGKAMPTDLSKLTDKRVFEWCAKLLDLEDVYADLVYDECECFFARVHVLDEMVAAPINAVFKISASDTHANVEVRLPNPTRWFCSCGRSLDRAICEMAILALEGGDVWVDSSSMGHAEREHV